MSNLQEPFEEFPSGRDFLSNVNHSGPLESGPRNDFWYPVFGIDNFDFSFDFECGTSLFPALDTNQPQGFGEPDLGRKPPSEPQLASGNMIFPQVSHSTDPHSLQLNSQTGTLAANSQLNELYLGPFDNVFDTLLLDQVYSSLYGSSTVATPELATPSESSASEPSSPSNDDSAPTPVATAPAAPSNVEGTPKATVASQTPVTPKADFTALGSSQYNIRAGKRRETPAPHSSEDSDGAGKRLKTSHSAEGDEPASGTAPSKHQNIQCPWPGCKEDFTYFDKPTMNRHYASKHENTKYACPGKCGYGPYCRKDVLTRHISQTPPGSRCREEALKLGWVIGGKKRGKRSGTRKEVVARMVRCEFV